MDNGFDNSVPVDEEPIVPEKRPERPKFLPKFTEDECSLMLVTSDQFQQILARHQKEMKEEEEEEMNGGGEEGGDSGEVEEEEERCDIVTRTSAFPGNILREVVEELIVPIKVQRQYECPNSQNDETPASNDVVDVVEETTIEVQQTQTFASPSKSLGQPEDTTTTTTTSPQKSPKQKHLNLPNISNFFKKKPHKSSSDKLDDDCKDSNTLDSSKDDSPQQTSSKPSFLQRMSFGKNKKQKKKEDETKDGDSKDGCSSENLDKSLMELKTEENKAKVESPERHDSKDEWSNMTAHYAVGQYLESHEIPPNSNQNIVVVAIDFGTAFSGYAYSFLNDPDQTIHMMGKWENGDPGVINQKTPTTLLLTPKGEFNSFGFTARNNYQDLSHEEATQWMLFDHFKMSLYKANSCNMNTTIEAVNGKKFSAFQAISMTLNFFKEHAIRELSVQTGCQLTNEDILWVLTVPAIWSSPAKQFMRLAAYQAGMASPERANKLIVALEPEAAAIHICRLRKHQLVSDRPVLFDFHKFKVAREPVVEHKLIEEFNKKCRYIILDCGGGTVDITVHEMDSETGLIHELQAASGGPYGASNIDLEFRHLLCKIFGKEFMDSFQLNCPNGWISLMMFFESRKRAADPLKPSSLNVAFPFSFLEHFRKTQWSTVENAIKKFGDPEIQWSPQGMLKLSQQSMQKLFKPCTVKIGECIANIIKNVEGIQYVFMVGGLSESPVLQHEIRSLCSELCGPAVKIIIPQEASLAVVKGAVSFGLYPEILTARRSRMTYGAAVLNIFDSNKHPQSKMVKKEGKTWCKDVFDVFVRAEELINCGHVVERSYVTADPKQTKMFVGIYCSTNQHPAYVTDSEVTKCANICLDLKPPSEEINQRFIRVRMEFAATEIKVTAVDASSGQHVDSRIDFLNF